MRRFALLAAAAVIAVCGSSLHAGDAAAADAQDPMAGVPGGKVPPGGVPPAAVPKPRIEEFEIPVANVDQLKAFYEALGMHERWQWTRPDGGTEIFMGFDNDVSPAINLVGAATTPDPKAKPKAKGMGGISIDLVVKDIKTVCDRVKAAGGKVLREPQKTPKFGNFPVGMAASVQDPDGITYALMEVGSPM